MEKVIDYRRKVDLPKVHASIAEWIEEFPLEWRRERRKEYLQNEIHTTREEFSKGCRDAFKRKDDFMYWTEKHLERLEKKLKRLNWEVGVFIGKVEGLSPEKIAKARNFPIEELLATQHGRAICPFHDDHRPSMDVRKNFYYCYTCGANGDVIDLAMHIYHIPFREAVDKLSRFYW